VLPSGPDQTECLFAIRMLFSIIHMHNSPMKGFDARFYYISHLYEFQPYFLNLSNDRPALSYWIPALLPKNHRFLRASGNSTPHFLTSGANAFRGTSPFASGASFKSNGNGNDRHAEE